MLTLVRRIFAVSGVAALAAGVFLAHVGDVRGAAAATLVGVGALLVGGRTRLVSAGPPGSDWLVLALVGAGMAILGFPLAIAGGGMAAVFVLQLILNAHRARRLGGVALEPVGADAVMAGAEPLVQELANRGFRTIGGHRCRRGGPTIITTVMIGPDRDRLALVTDRVWEVGSRFDSRWLVTINTATSALPLDILRQWVRGGAPSDVARVHQSALEVLERTSVRPDRFSTDAEALESALAMEHRAIEFVRTASLATSLRLEIQGPQAGVLRGDRATPRRIDALTASATVTMSATVSSTPCDSMGHRFTFRAALP
jgi:hypothetical protein